MTDNQTLHCDTQNGRHGQLSDLGSDDRRCEVAIRGITESARDTTEGGISSRGVENPRPRSRATVSFTPLHSDNSIIEELKRLTKNINSRWLITRLI